MESQRSKDLARAATLRERIIGALKAAPHAMPVSELCSMSGITTLYHQRLLPEKVDTQLRSLKKTGVVKQTGRMPGRGGAMLWEINRDHREAQPSQPAAAAA